MILPPTNAHRERLVLVMVGLPARGKSYIAKKLRRYLRWLGYRSKVFNVGNFRREAFGAAQPHEFFSSENDAASRARMEAAEMALAAMLRWFEDEEGEIGILDATNSTRERRRWVRRSCEAHGLSVIFIESVCTDQTLVDRNIIASKMHSADYPTETENEVLEDFKLRIAHYERAYETINNEALSYIKLIDVGQRVVANRIHGHLASRLVYYLMNIYIARRRIWLTRHGESLYNLEDRIGGDSDLSQAGREYARRLGEFMQSKIQPGLVVHCSTLRRTHQTAQPIGLPFRAWKALDEIDAGVCDGMTYEEIEEKMPEEFAARKEDKLRYRYPQGESYEDLVHRTENVIIELERSRNPVLVVAHQAVLRVLYAYFMNKSPEACPHLEVPLHTLIELEPQGEAFLERRHPIL